MFETEEAAPPERPYLIWFLGLAAGGVLLLTVAACNTVAGLGEDVSAAGNQLSETAEDVKN
jgi:predicted small secreted protein